MTNGINCKIVDAVVGCRQNAEKRLFYHRAIVLVITFFIYATYHMSRRPLSIVKSQLQHGNFSDDKEWNLFEISNGSSSNNTGDGWPPFNGDDGKKLLGLMDICFLGIYAVFMFFSGYVAERSNLRYFISISLALCGIVCISFGLAYSFNIHSLPFFIILQVISGIFQTTGWPSVLAVIGTWFGSTKKGLIFGIWNIHTSFGNIIGAAIAGIFVEYNWGLSFIVPGLICIGLAVIVFFILVPKPSDVGIEVELIVDDEGKQEVDQTNKTEGSEHAISIWEALLIPGVIDFSVSLFFTKLVSYVFLYWLPDYLKETSNFSSSTSAYASIVFDIGGCIGSIIAGLIADRSGASGLTCMGFMVVSAPTLFVFYKYSNTSMMINQVLQFITGFVINAPYSLITTAVSANLACKVPTQSAMATVSALIDGTGSLGAAIGPALVGVISTHNWDSVMYLTIGSNLIAIVMLVRVAAHEVKRLRQTPGSSN